MSRCWLAVLGLMGLAAAAVADEGASLCTRLAQEARRAPASTWAAPDPWSAWVKPAAAAAPSPLVDALVRDARWREQLGVSEDHLPAVQQLAGAPVYLLEAFAGTANCQSLALVQARPGRPARQLRPPFDLQGLDLCTTRSASFARVLGQPAFVVGGAPSMTSPDLDYRIATWSGQGWGGRCGVTLRRQVALTAARRFCAPGGRVCDAGQPVAQQLALAYEAARGANQPLDGTAVNGARRPDAAVVAALNPPLAEDGAIGNMNPPFPLFGADEKRLDPMLTVFSNAAPQVLPVWVQGRWWLAVVGRSGVGWREGAAVLVALFAAPGRAADGVASYQFLVRPSALRDVVVSNEVR